MFFAVCVGLLLIILSSVQSKQPNIIAIIADDLGWNDVSFHGSNQFVTPNIDALAYNGIILNRHYVQPTCTPSRSAFLTGKYPIHTGMQGQPIGLGQIRGIPLTEKLLPQYLKDLGYDTHLVGKWHVGSHKTTFLPTKRGFDTFFGFTSGYLDYFNGIHDSQILGSGIDTLRNTSDAWQEFAGNYLTDLLTDEAVNIINKHDTAKPLYLQVAHAAPHAANPGNTMQVRDIAENYKMFPHIGDQNRRLYAGMVKALDDSVGNIVKTLSTTGLLNNSIIVFMADNGGASLERIWNTSNYASNWPLRGEKCSAHEGGVRGVAAAWSPLFPKGYVSSDLMHITDWLPTFYEAAGGNMTSLKDLGGVSQLSILKSQVGKRNKVRNTVLVEIDWNQHTYALINGQWKIIKYNTSTSWGYTNLFYGTSGRDAHYPDYNLLAVQNSTVGITLSKYGKMNETHYKEIRQQANIESLCKAVTSHQTMTIKPCDNKYCLFNIVEDPCETMDLSHTNQDILNDLLTELEAFNTTVVPVPKELLKSDPSAHPKYWQNYWTPWLDDQDSNASPQIFSINFVIQVATTLMILSVNYCIYS